MRRKAKQAQLTSQFITGTIRDIGLAAITTGLTGKVEKAAQAVPKTLEPVRLTFPQKFSLLS